MESVLPGMELSSGLAVVVNSPGGDPLAAEGIIRVCPSYSGTGRFVTIVPGQAKSAATMVCMGAERIVMGPASELGPVDPQVARVDQGQVKWFSAHTIVRSFKSLFEEAVTTEGNLGAVSATAPELRLAGGRRVQKGNQAFRGYRAACSGLGYDERRGGIGDPRSDQDLP